MAYDNELPGCFGNNDLIFAGHPLDADRAFNWLGSLRKRHIGLAAVKEQVREFLTERGASAAHIDEQLSKVERRFGPGCWTDPAIPRRRCQPSRLDAGGITAQARSH
ncbi:hypothetical protein L6654_08065 [Bradyrhizobium sp. WYCCWR 13023]|uniref:Uncharacterized protein n=1 Tax=Bradyrhizobium zhengyangense TaxID=2911009 RepID=A0A9X1R7S8_9BRAD|nr:hypothetical protein [Bradyrhizobium zhengyangense]MCG2626577.1 hypothetical protein [Bradyrhizobium zhengyangense]